ncbi:MAG: DUF6624 domain-containing protein [Bacteroidota bacterium]
MKKLITIFYTFLSIGFVTGQTNPPPEPYPSPVYYALVKMADSLSMIKDYKKSAEKYTEAFKTYGGYGLMDDRYNASCSWALAGYPDSAFYNLNRIANIGKYSDYRHITTDPDLMSLRADNRWQPLLDLIYQNREKKYEAVATYNIPLIYLLDSMAADDQKWRTIIHNHSTGELINDTLSEKAMYKQVRLIDSMNYFILKQIFAKYGFPNYDLVGQEGSRNFWLLVQHQDAIPSFQDSVLLKMKIEVDAKKASGANYAYLVDRVNLHNGRLQVFGTQLEYNSDNTSFIIPKGVIDPDKLNERRKSVGLNSIEDYIKQANSLFFSALKKN